MIESIKYVKDLIFVSSKSLGTTTARIVSLFALLIILNLSFNFTYDLHTSNKLSQLEKTTRKNNFNQNLIQRGTYKNC